MHMPTPNAVLSTALVLTALVGGSCSGSSTTETPVTPTSPPEVVAAPALLANNNLWVPLVASFSVSADRPVQVEITLDDGSGPEAPVLAVTDFLAQHAQVPVLGLKPDSEYSVTVRLIDSDGRSTTINSALTVTTQPLPAYVPKITVPVSDPARMEDGVVAASVFVTGAQFRGFYMMFNKAGELVWLFDNTQNPFTETDNLHGIPMPDGTLLIRSGDSLVLQIDMLGNQLGAWHSRIRPAGRFPADSVAVATDTFHHEFQPLPAEFEGDFIALSTEVRTIANYPANEIDPTITDPTAEVVGDVFVEFKRDGTITNEIKTLDFLDPFRVCYDTLDDFWDRRIGLTNSRDWSHGNALQIDPSDKNYIASFRHQDAVVKFDRITGEVIWILGDHDRWVQPWASKLLTPVPGQDFEWQYHQHAPYLTADGTMLLFDNGNNRAVPPLAPLDPTYSRVAEYRINEQAMTVEQVWAFGGAFDTDPTHDFYSFALGDANEMEVTRNVLATDGIFSENGVLIGRVIEVTRGNPSDIVFEVVLGDSSDPANGAAAIYRAQKLSGLYR